MIFVQKILAININLFWYIITKLNSNFLLLKTVKRNLNKIDCFQLKFGQFPETITHGFYQVCINANSKNAWGYKIISLHVGILLYVTRSNTINIKLKTDSLNYSRK